MKNVASIMQTIPVRNASSSEFFAEFINSVSAASSWYQCVVNLNGSELYLDSLKLSSISTTIGT